MTPASVAIILSKVETIDVHDPALIGWEPITDDLEENEENRKAIAGCVLDCRGLWNSKPIPHRLVRTGNLISLWTVPATAPEDPRRPAPPPPSPAPQPTTPTKPKRE